MAAALHTIRLVGSDGTVVEFASTYLPAMRTLHTFTDEDTTTGTATTEFVISETDSTTLTLMRYLLNLQTATAATPFRQPSIERTYRGIKTADPCYANGEDPWRATPAAGIYAAAFAKIPVGDICRVFALCDYLDCTDLLHGIAYVLIPRIFDYDTSMRGLLEPHLKDALATIHVAAITLH